MPQMRAAFHTLGCRTNHYETDAIRSQFLQAGFIEVPFDAAADVYLLNTCTVTGEADRKSRQLLRRARRLNPGAVIAAVGCHVELHASQDLADIRIGCSGKHLAVSHVLAELGRRGLAVADAGGAAAAGCAAGPAVVSDAAGAEACSSSGSGWQYEEFGLVGRPQETRAYIKIEDGCNNFCSYCTVPLARGPVRSRAKEMILEEARVLANQGYREIVLTGIHVCSYGADQGLPSHTVAELSLELAGIPGIERIRLGSLEPQSITAEFIRLARDNAKLLPHFHLSLQSGSDSVLRRMGRHYLSDDYRKVVASLRQAYESDEPGPGQVRGPGPGLSTDIIVGFPGETAAEHKASLAFCREIGFSRLHVFRYSSRPGTAAASMPSQVSPALISARAEAMLDLAGELALDFHRRQIGRWQDVLLEERQPEGFAGYTSEYVPVRVPFALGRETGRIIKVKAISANRDFLVCQ